jgi:hypothetical protein
MEAIRYIAGLLFRAGSNGFNRLTLTEPDEPWFDRIRDDFARDGTVVVVDVFTDDGFARVIRREVAGVTDVDARFKCRASRLSEGLDVLLIDRIDVMLNISRTKWVKLKSCQ